jgi:hypothetical protein
VLVDEDVEVEVEVDVLVEVDVVDVELVDVVEEDDDEVVVEELAALEPPHASRSVVPAKSERKPSAVAAKERDRTAIEVTALGRPRASGVARDRCRFRACEGLDLRCSCWLPRAVARDLPSPRTLRIRRARRCRRRRGKRACPWPMATRRSTRCHRRS